MSAPKAQQNSDSPTLNDTLASLEAEAIRPGPYVIGTAEGRISFPDPGEMDWEKGEEWILDLGVKKDSDLFKKWLTADDFAKLQRSGLTLSGKVVLVNRLQKHYGPVFGAVGEGQPSGS